MEFLVDLGNDADCLFALRPVIVGGRGSLVHEPTVVRSELMCERGFTVDFEYRVAIGNRGRRVVHQASHDEFEQSAISRPFVSGAAAVAIEHHERRDVEGPKDDPQLVELAGRHRD